MKAKRMVALLAVFAMLVTMMPSVLAVDAEGGQSEFTFPLRYDAEKMAAADGDSVVLADYGITGRALWTVKRGTAYDLPKIGYGVRNSGDNAVPQSPNNNVDFAFADNKVTTPPVLDDGCYTIETENAIVLASPESMDFVVKASNGTGELEIAKVRIAKTGSQSSGKAATGKVFVANADGSAMTNTVQKDLKVSKKNNGSSYGDLLQIKFQVNLKHNLFTVWAKVRQTEGGTYDASPLTSADLLIKDAPLLNPASELTGFGIKCNEKSGKYTYSGGVEMTYLSIAPEVYQVSGTVDANVSAVRLMIGSETAYTGTIDHGAGTVAFSGVAPGTYTVEADFAAGYMAEVMTESVTVDAAAVNDLSVTSKIEAYPVSGAVDGGVAGVTLTKTGAAEPVYTGTIADNTVSFSDVLPGTYDVGVTAKENYTVKADNPAQITLEKGVVTPALSAATEFNFPLVYDPGSMDKTSGSTLNINKYGIYLGDSSAMRTADLTNSADSQNINAIRFSVNNGKKPSSPLEMMYMIFTSNQAKTPPALDADGYVIEADYTVWLHGGKQLDFVINGTDADGRAKPIGIVRAARSVETAVGGDAGVMYAADAEGNKLEGSNETAIVVTKPGDKTYAGDLVSVKAVANLKTQTLSLWAKVKKSHGGSLNETPMSDENLLLRDIPFFTEVTAIRGLSMKIYSNDGNAIEYGCGSWVTRIQVDKGCYPVSGTVDMGVKTVFLMKNGNVIYTAAAADGQIRFPQVASGTYDVAVEYNDRYVEPENQSKTVTVAEAEKTDFNLSSVKVDDSARNVSGTVDAGVQSVTLTSQSDQKSCEGVIDRASNTIVFKYLLPGTYDVLVTAKEGYAVSEGNAATITVADTDITDAAFRTDINVFTVTGTVAEQVSRVTLTNGKTVYDGVISGGTVTFAGIPNGTYTVAAECEQRYTPAVDNTSVTVSGAGRDSAFAVTAAPPQDGITLRLGVLSDTQYGRGGLGITDHSRKQFRNAMAALKNRIGGSWDNLDVLMMPGDISHNTYWNGSNQELDLFFQDLKECLGDSKLKVLFLRGNHDAKNEAEIAQDPMNNGNFVKAVRQYYDPDYVADFIEDVNGYQFVMVSQDTRRGNDDPSDYADIHSEKTVEWFGKAIAQAEEKSAGKPVFVGMHPNTYDPEVSGGKPDVNSGTVFGSFPIDGFINQSAARSSYWATGSLYSAMKPYDNIITFSGHSHWTTANERSIHQRDFTSINTGAVNNMEIENAWDEPYQPKRFGSNENESNGYYITVNTDQKVNIERLDLYRMNRDNNVDARLGEDWVVDIAAGKAGFTYTENRDTEDPVFAEGAAVTVQDITATSAELIWDNRKVLDDTGVNNYWIEIVNKETNATEKIYTPSAYYWLPGDEMPEKNNQTAKGLSAETAYEVRVYAMDQFYKKTAVPITAEFTTPAREVLPAPLIDVSFTDADNGIRDHSNYARVYDMDPLVTGKTEMTWDDTYHMYVANFAAASGTSASPNFFKVLLDDGRRSLMQESGGYTIDLLFKPEALNAGIDAETAVIGAAQTNGFDILYTKSSELTAELRHDGAWQYPAKVQAPLNQYHHVTAAFDGKQLVFYLDGEKQGSVAASGKLEFTAAQVADSFYGLVIGGDYKPGTSGADQTEAQSAFTGQIAYAKIYGGALSQKEITRNHQALVSRAELTQAGALRTMLTQTLPNMKNDTNKLQIEGLLDEGWRLLASETLTDEAIAAYLAKASALERCVVYTLDANRFPEKAGSGGADVTVANPSQYGITITNNGWSLAKNNSANSLHIESLRMTDRGGDSKTPVVTGEVARFDFAKDTVNNPNGMAFAGNYTFESEFVLRYSGDQYYAYRFNGKDGAGEEQIFAELRFGKDKAYLVNAAGEQIGKAVAVDLEDDGPAQAFYVKAELDTETDTYSMWLIPRKSKTSPYHGTEPGAANCLGAGLSFNQTVSQFSGISTYVNTSKATNGVWLYNIRVSGAQPAAADRFSAVLNVDLDALLASNTADAVVTVQNPKGEEKTLRMIYAVYDNNHSLVKIETERRTVSASELNAAFSKTLTLTAEEAQNASAVKVYVWDDLTLNPFAYAGKQL